MLGLLSEDGGREGAHGEMKILLLLVCMFTEAEKEGIVSTHRQKSSTFTFFLCVSP